MHCDTNDSTNKIILFQNKMPHKIDFLKAYIKNVCRLAKELISSNGLVQLYGWFTLNIFPCQNTISFRVIKVKYCCESTKKIVRIYIFRHYKIKNFLPDHFGIFYKSKPVHIVVFFLNPKIE